MKKTFLIILFCALITTCVGCEKINDYLSPSQATSSDAHSVAPDATVSLEPSVPVAATTESSQNSIVTVPDKSHLGTWYDYDSTSDVLTISEINTNTIKFEMEVYRTRSIDATAEIENNNIVFSGNIEADGGALSGTLKFISSSILVTIDKPEFPYITDGTTYNFTIKDES